MLIFNKLRFKNILSVGNYFIEIPLDKYSNTVISGENGSGKSSILDAICFALFNRPFRNVNKGDIVNSLNGKLLCEVEFTKGSDKFLVRRGQKPTIFEIYKNDILIEEDAHSRDYQKYLENVILQMNFKTFTQVVVLGSAVHTPFMQLKTPERRALVESLLDLEIFTSMNVIAKQKLSDIKEELKEMDLKITKKEMEIETKEKYIQKVEDESDDRISSYRNDIAEHQNNIKEESNKLVEHTKKYKAIDIAKLTSTRDTLRTQRRTIIQERGGTEFLSKEVKQRIEFFSKKSVCPTCSQIIDEKFKHNIEEEFKSKSKDLSDQIERLRQSELAIDDKVTKLDEAFTKIQSLEKIIQTINTNIGKFTDKIEFFQQEIQRIEQIKDLKQDKQDLKEYRQQLKNLLSEKETLQKNKGLYEISLILLKDTGVKAEIIKSYVPLINQIINQYLNILDLFVKFELDQNFEESLKHRHQDNRTYFSFSEGEKARIDISILFMFREISRRRNTAATNLLIMDEILDSALDAHGSECMVKMLKGLQSNNIIISHDPSIIDSFSGRDDSSITVQKKGNFTYYNM